MKINKAGLGNVDVDSIAFTLRPFSVGLADKTTRIDCKMDGTLDETDVNFKNSGYESSLRLVGWFGDAKDELTQDNLIYGQKNGKSYFEGQITASNDPVYIYQADLLYECIARELREFYYLANELFISDYNIKNYSYRLVVTPVIIDGLDEPIYHENRTVSLRINFKDRQKNKRKNNC
jgi:hypothetical protein